MSKEGVEVLRLHTDADGCVWFGDDMQLAVNTYLEPSAFVEGAGDFDVDMKAVKTARVLGVRENAALLVALQCFRGPGFSADGLRFQLASPGALPASCRLEPAEVLQHLWQPPPALAASFHLMGREDYCTYAMIDQMSGKDDVGEAARKIVAYHPAWPPLSFVAGFSREDACRLVREVVDPRWYRHEEHPGRWTRLFNYMGLVPANVAAYLGEGEPARHYGRALVVLRSWYEHQMADRRGRNIFLWERYSRHDSKVRGLLEAGKRLLFLVVLLWQNAVTGPHPELTFDPKKFFGSGVEAAAFASHMNRLKAV
jgi:hypothetical protein